MGLGETLLLGFIAGATILIGLPVGRMKRPAVGMAARVAADRRGLGPVAVGPPSSAFSSATALRATS